MRAFCNGKIRFEKFLALYFFKNFNDFLIFKKKFKNLFKISQNNF